MEEPFQAVVSSDEDEEAGLQVTRDKADMTVLVTYMLTCGSKEATREGDRGICRRPAAAQTT